MAPSLPSPASSSPPRPAIPSFWVLHVTGWLAIGVSMWVGVLPHHAEPLTALVGKMTFALWGGLLTLGVRPFYRWLHDRGTSLPVLITILAITSYALSCVWSVSYKASLDVLWAVVEGTSLEVSPFSQLISGALFYTFIPMAWGVLYVGIKYYLDLQEERERALAAEGLAYQAHLEALRYQLNPHFLFNTLNAISTLVVERNNDDAERMVARLSDFLRLTLDRGGDVEVPLAEEMDFVQRYLDIQTIRFGDRLDVSMDVDANTLSACVPPLLLQPIVENAIRHGIISREEGGRLAIESRRVGDSLHLRVSDDGPGPPSADALSTGVGLTNVRDRLDALYGDDHAFALDRADGGGCVVTIALPFHTTPLDPNVDDAAPPDAAPPLMERAETTA